MRIRPYTPADAAAASAFLASSHALDKTIVAVSPPAWKSFTAMSFNHGARDFAVMDGQDGELVALLMSTRFSQDGIPLRNFRIFVHPSHRRQGLGTRFLAYVEGQDPAGDATLQCSCPQSWSAGRAFLQTNGFETMNLDLEMSRRGPAPASIPLPAGYSLRPYTPSPSNDVAWRALHADGYAGTHGYQPMTPSDHEAGRAVPDFHMWFLVQGDAVCGLCETSATGDGSGGLLESIVVGAEHRGRGLGRALVIAGLSTLAEQDYTTIHLGVFDANTAAKALYRSLGFKTYSETQTWRRAPGYSPSSVSK